MFVEILSMEIDRGDFVSFEMGEENNWKFAWVVKNYRNNWKNLENSFREFINT